MNLLPCPRFQKRHSGFYTVSERGGLHLDGSLPRDTVLLPLAERLQSATAAVGVMTEVVAGPSQRRKLPGRLAIRVFQSAGVLKRPGAYELAIGPQGIALKYRDVDGLRAGVATLRHLFREHGRRVPPLPIQD